jgi:hypothetical protein
VCALAEPARPPFTQWPAADDEPMLKVPDDEPMLKVPSGNGPSTPRHGASGMCPWTFVTAPIARYVGVVRGQAACERESLTLTHAVGCAVR